MITKMKSDADNCLNSINTKVIIFKEKLFINILTSESARNTVGA